MTDPSHSRRSLKGFLGADVEERGDDPLEVMTPTTPVAPSRESLPMSNVHRVDDEEPTTFDPRDARLQDELPPNCALLCVTAAASHEKPRFKLNFHFAGAADESTDAEIADQEVPDLSLASIAERQQWRDDYYELMDWWADKAHLRRWIRQLLMAAHTTSARLVVWDNTNHQIPWELYYVGPSASGDPGWLGALIDIVRWTSIHDDRREARYTAVETVSSGTVLVMETDDIDPDLRVADLVAPYGPPPQHEMLGLLDLLDQDDLQFALLFVHCHGVNATNGRTFELGGVALNEFTDREMRALSSCQSVVILNACNTAKIVPAGAYSTLANRSFAELFLRQGASTVVATLAQVGLDHTHDFARGLIRAEGAEKRIATFLRMRRLRHARKVMRPKGVDTRKSWHFEEFFYSFMYVCFGHPDTEVHLVETKAERVQ